VAEDLQSLTGSSKPTEEQRKKWREVALKSTYAFAKTVCGFHDLDADIHGTMAWWIQRPSRLKLGVAPRGFFKTSVWTIADALRRATVDPNTRTLLSNEIQDNAEKWIGVMQEIVMSPLYRWLFPEVVPDPTRVKWNAHQLELRRTAKWPEATIEACGVGGASTSNHYDRQKNDDLVGKAARESPLVMAKAIDHRKLCWSLMVDASKSAIDDVGTRWAPKDVIDYVRHTVRGLDCITMSIRKPNGEPSWPERYPDKVIEQIRVEQGPLLFALQYENRVVGEGVTELDPELCCYWRETEDQDGKTILILEGAERRKRVYLDDCFVFQVIDAGLTKESRSARTANVVAALTPPSPTEPFDIVFLEAKATHSDPNQVLAEAKKSYDEWDPIFAAIEVFGGHVAYFYWAAEAYPEMRIRKLPTDTSRNAKDARIRGFWGAYLRQRRIYIRKSDSELLRELASYPNDTVDLLDSAGYLPKIWAPPNPVDEHGQTIGDDDERESRVRYGEEETDDLATELAERTRSDYTGY
jgi:hypothetical protein